MTNPERHLEINAEPHGAGSELLAVPEVVDDQEDKAALASEELGTAQQELGKLGLAPAGHNETTPSLEPQVQTTESRKIGDPIELIQSDGSLLNGASLEELVLQRRAA